MKRSWKIFLIALGSVVGLVLATVAVALWLVFTPARLTPIVAKQLPHFVTCRAEIDRVELTFFSSFPRLGLQAEGIRLVNPVEGAPCDTLVRLDELRAVVDAKAFLRRDELILSDIVLRDGVVCLYTDSLGRTNYDVIKSAREPDTGDTGGGGFSISRIDAGDVTLENIDVRYADDASLLYAGVRGLSASLGAAMNGDNASGAIATSRPFDLYFSMGRADSLLTASVKGLTVTATVSKTGDMADAGLTGLGAAGVTAAYGGEEYLRDANISLSGNASADLVARSANIRDLALTINGLRLNVDGTVRSEASGGTDADPAPTPATPAFAVDLRYSFSDWAPGDLLALVPASFVHLTGGIDAGGRLSSEGSVTGVYGNGSMPVIAANIVLDEGRVEYPQVFPYPLTDVAANIDIVTDLSDAASYAVVNTLSARTPRSSLRASGRVDNLFSDPHADLVADVAADLADAAPFIPASLELTADGKLSGRVTADVRMSQLSKMQLDRMRLSGSLLATGIDARYDTISVKIPSAHLDFALPNPEPSTRHTSFAAVSLAADRFDASMTDGTAVALDGMKLALETSDVLDSHNVPAVVCDFAFANLAARLDDMSVKAAGPSGKISMEPGRRGVTQRIRVAWNSAGIEGEMGDIGAMLEKLDIDATVNYDATQKDIWQKLAPRGSIAATGTEVNVPSLNYPVRVPALAMDFTPRRADIREARVILDESDFSLDGTVDNIMPYFRGDSVLRAEFNFASPVTNLSQLLALTNGIGHEEEEGGEEAPEADSVDPAAPATPTAPAAPAAPTAPATSAAEFSGPYMVPRGVDITLHAGIDELLWDGHPFFFNIGGDVQVKDGAIFISPQISFDSPATHGEMQLMYRTPGRNNLFAGISLHLDRIEMQELVSMIPDLEELLPMIRSFSGQGEFHAAAEGYMDSTYRFKMSTLRGAGSIGATNLTLKDDETFRKIAFLLKYKDEGVIRVDSLRAEFTVFRNEIDVYPFLLSVDRYKAVISGRHNLDMNFDYNISLVQSPLPFRVAVDVQGRGDDLKFKAFSKSRYPEFYRPQYQGVVENRQMELRNIIRNSLLEGRKEEE